MHIVNWNPAQSTIKVQKISLVNGQSAQKSWSKFWPVVTAMTRDSNIWEWTPPATGFCTWNLQASNDITINKQWQSCMTAFRKWREDRWCIQKPRNLSSCGPAHFHTGPWDYISTVSSSHLRYNHCSGLISPFRLFEPSKAVKITSIIKLGCSPIRISRSSIRARSWEKMQVSTKKN